MSICESKLGTFNFRFNFKLYIYRVSSSVWFAMVILHCAVIKISAHKIFDFVSAQNPAAYHSIITSKHALHHHINHCTFFVKM